MSRRNKDDFVNQEIPQSWLLVGLVGFGLVASILFFTLVLKPMYFANNLDQTQDPALTQDIVPVAARPPQSAILKATVSIISGSCSLPGVQTNIFTLAWKSDVASVLSAHVSDSPSGAGGTWEKNLRGLPSNSSISGPQDFVTSGNAYLELIPGKRYYAWVTGFIENSLGGMDRKAPRGAMGIGDGVSANNVSSNVVSFIAPACPSPSASQAGTDFLMNTSTPAPALCGVMGSECASSGNTCCSPLSCYKLSESEYRCGDESTFAQTPTTTPTRTPTRTPTKTPTRTPTPTVVPGKWFVSVVNYSGDMAISGKMILASLCETVKQFDVNMQQGGETFLVEPEIRRSMACKPRVLGTENLIPPAGYNIVGWDYLPGDSQIVGPGNVYMTVIIPRLQKNQ